LLVFYEVWKTIFDKNLTEIGEVLASYYKIVKY